MVNLSYLKKRANEHLQLYLLSKIVAKEKQVDNERLGFIISPGRSGTTFLRKQLVENTSTHIPPESSSFIITAARKYIKSTSWEGSVEETLDTFEGLGLNEFWQIDTEELSKYLLRTKTQNRSLQSLIMGFYWFHGSTHNQGCNAYVDKSPFLSQNLMWLKTVFPNSNYLFLIRDPYEVTYSRMANFNENIRLASSKWIWSVKELDKFYNKLNWKLVYYEDLVTGLNNILPEVTKFFGASLSDIKKKVHLGEDHFKHHEKLNEKTQKFKNATFGSDDRQFLKKRFSRINNYAIKKYYHLADE